MPPACATRASLDTAYAPTAQNSAYLLNAHGRRGRWIEHDYRKRKLRRKHVELLRLANIDCILTRVVADKHGSARGDGGFAGLSRRGWPRELTGRCALRARARRGRGGALRTRARTRAGAQAQARRGQRARGCGAAPAAAARQRERSRVSAARHGRGGSAVLSEPRAERRGTLNALYVYVLA